MTTTTLYVTFTLVATKATVVVVIRIIVVAARTGIMIIVTAVFVSLW